MAEHVTGPGSRPQPPIGEIRKTTAHAAPKTGDAARSPAFEALLESLEAQARALEDQSRGVERPDELAQAVETAHDSLAAVLSLGDRLLEAYREALQRGTADAPRAGDPSAEPKEVKP